MTSDKGGRPKAEIDWKKVEDLLHVVWELESLLI